MSSFELKDLLQAIGPTASLIFAAWIFLNFLQQRFVAAYQWYRNLLQEYRQRGRGDDTRADSLRTQILSYRRRCEQMRIATSIGVWAAIALLATLICGALAVMAPGPLGWLKYGAGALAVAGLLLVIWAAGIVLLENAGLRRMLEDDLADVPELQRGRSRRAA
ncbi:MAG: DUF2721 domain-containing protein [Gammaproteobacteria bacterium]|nr:DUF2721 domain-containing protein [Gammaproteobacteria bacterium]